MDGYEGSHLVISGLLRFGVNLKIHSLNHLPDIRAQDDLIGKFLEMCLSLQQQDGQAEFH